MRFTQTQKNQDSIIYMIICKNSILVKIIHRSTDKVSIRIFITPNFTCERLRKQKNKTKLFDKRDAFPFSIVSMAHLDSTAPSNIHYTILPEITLILILLYLFLTNF